ARLLLDRYRLRHRERIIPRWAFRRLVGAIDAYGELRSLASHKRNGAVDPRRPPLPDILRPALTL
ncbi:MAG TPA: hypothetical protein VFS60_18665, partial [Thermoanaerobaculia bacterium]|nr:hypothetical protein [Thermoanaerobaculia bacterium]